MKNYELDNGILHLSLAEDASRLVLRSRDGGVCYDAADYAAFGYGGWYRYELSGRAAAEVRQENNELRIVFSRVDYRVRFPENGFRKPDPGPDLRFTFRIRLEEDEAVFLTEKVEGMDGETVHVEFPARPLRWNAALPGELAFSNGSFGTLWGFPTEFPGSFSDGNDPLPLGGYFNASGGVGFRIPTPFDQTTQYTVSECSGHGGVSFRFERGVAEYEREIRIFFLPPGANYVQLAKFYREKIRRAGRFVSLKEKIAADPEVGQLPGSVLWKHNVYLQERPPVGVEPDYSLYVPTLEAGRWEGKVGNWSAREVFDAAHRAGFDRVCILNTGWNHYGFDSGYPTRFPINAERGSEEDFRASAAYGRSLSPDYLLSVHDNYRDAYPNSPEFDFDEMIRDAEGVPLRGGIWRGGRCYLMCGKNSLRYAKRDLPRIAALSGRGCIYVDVLGCVAFRSCRHPAHPGSGRDDAARRLEILQEAKRHFGAVATEGSPHDFCASTVDVGAYCAIRRRMPGQKLRPIPLWQLVYHDSVLNYAGEGVSGVFGFEFRNYLALYGLLPAGLDGEQLRISRELRRTCCEEMISHEFLPDEFQRTVFADGTVVTADFSFSGGGAGSAEAGERNRCFWTVN